MKNKKGTAILEGLIFLAVFTGTVVYGSIVNSNPPNWHNSSVSNPSPHLNYDNLGGGGR